MKSFHLTVWSITLLFVTVMAVVTTVAFSRKSNQYKIDPAQIRELREMARKGDH